jgi:hypothetical protein
MKSNPGYARLSRIDYFVSADRLVKQINNLFLAIHQGFWLGWLDHRRLIELVERQYHKWENYRTDSYNLSGLQPWEKKVVDQYLINCHSILVGAVGGGREVLSLVQQGYAVDGFDCFPEFIDSARNFLRSQNIDSCLELAQPDHVPPTFEVYDGVMIGWAGYSQIRGRKNRVNFLTEVYSHIQPGGPVLISFFSRPGNSPRYRIIYLIAQCIRNLRFCTEKVESGDALDESFFHYFTHEEIETELTSAGFRMACYSVEGFGHAIGIAV